jgi:hypothetical protein
VREIFAVKKSGVLLLALAMIGLLSGGLRWWVSYRRAESAGKNLPMREQPRGTSVIVVPPPLAPRPHLSGLSAAEKSARLEKIRADYDEITAKISTDYGVAGDKFPGGVNAFLRQLALLAREKHADLAAFLTPRELEDVEMRDTPAGQAVQRQLGDTAATDEQRRAAFELERMFEDKFALTFDLSPAALLARESDRVATQAKIRDALGDNLFGAWLRGEGTEYASTVAFAQQQGLAPGVPLDLWRVKNDFLLAQLELKARLDLSPAQLRDASAGLVNQATLRVTSLIGAAALANASNDVVGWLPRAPQK